MSHFSTVSQTTLHSRTAGVLFVCFRKSFATRNFKHIACDGGNALYDLISVTVIIIIIIIIIIIVRTHQHNTDSVVLQRARCLKTEVQKETRKVKDSIAEKTKESWQGNRMHGQFTRNLDEKLADIEQSYHRWHKSGDIKGETESKIVAAQDQAISTNYFKNKILKQETESKCRLCKQHEETTDHLTSQCPILAKNEYVMRHDKVCTNLHYSICKALSIETTDKWYTHMPKPVCEEGDVTVLWNQAVHTRQRSYSK